MSLLSFRSFNGALICSPPFITITTAKFALFISAWITNSSSESSDTLTFAQHHVTLSPRDYQCGMACRSRGGDRANPHVINLCREFHVRCSLVSTSTKHGEMESRDRRRRRRRRRGRQHKWARTCESAWQKLFTLRATLGPANLQNAWNVPAWNMTGLGTRHFFFFLSLFLRSRNLISARPGATRTTFPFVVKRRELC